MAGYRKPFLLLLLILPLLSACGSDEADTCGGVALGLDGTWFGALEDDQGSLFTLEWQVCGDRITRKRLSGPDYGLTGRLVREGGGVYVAYLSDGSTSRLLTAPGLNHGLMVNDFFDFALIQRGAQILPQYRFSDLDGSWSGRHARLLPSATRLQSTLAWCGSGFCSLERADGEIAQAEFLDFNRDFGLYLGDYTDGWSNQGIAGALMSPDRQVLGTYTCTAGYQSPADCGFGIYWRR